MNRIAVSALMACRKSGNEVDDETGIPRTAQVDECGKANIYKLFDGRQHVM